MMCQKLPAVRFRQGLDYLKHIGDRFIYGSRPDDVGVEFMENTQHEFTYFRIACDCLSCSESVIYTDMIHLER